MRCTHCKAVFDHYQEAVPVETEVAYDPAADPLIAPRPVHEPSGVRLRRYRPVPHSSNRVAVVLLLIGVCLAVLGGGGAVVYFTWRGGVRLTPNLPGVPVINTPAFNPAVKKEALDRLKEGMTLAEVEAILGPARKADVSDFRAAFAEDGRPTDGYYRERGLPSEQWEHNGRTAGVSQWYQWRSLHESIFVGFKKGQRSGKEKAIACFWVKSFQNLGAWGFHSEPGFVSVGDSDEIEKARKKDEKLLNDPKWKRGNPRELLVGKWQAPIGLLMDGYEFSADGTVRAFGITEYTSTYRFVDDHHMEITIPGQPNSLLLSQPTQVKYRVLVTEDELILVMDGSRRVPPAYKRAR
jgi:hypothetical protein